MLPIVLIVCILGPSITYLLFSGQQQNRTLLLLHGNVTHGAGQHDGFTIKSGTAVVTPNINGYYTIPIVDSLTVYYHEDIVAAFGGPYDAERSYDVRYDIEIPTGAEV